MFRALRSALVVTTLAGTMVLVGGPVPPGSGPTAPAAHAAASDELESRFLTTRPTVGPTWVADLAGSSAAERMMLRTLQGLVNRSVARLYLRDPGDLGAQRWLDEYQARGLITVAGTLSVAEVLDTFAAEASGYVLATESEPWTLTAAANIAAVEGAVVATPELVAALEARGLTLVDDVRGRWTDAATAYEDVIAAHRDDLPYKGIAVMEATDTSWDFTMQQGIPTVFSRPSSPDWSRVLPLITASGPGHAVYGYLSDTGDEEVVAVAALSANGQFLVPTDTSRNLSFHLAVEAGQVRQPAATPSVDVAPCTDDQLNVVVGISDGDNVNVPLSRYSAPGGWPSARRGDLPLGWSIGPQLSILAPAVWDTYADQATAADELTGIIGYGYAAPPLLADPETFYRDSFALMEQLGMRTFWSLGGGLETPLAGAWDVVDRAAGAGMPDGVLIGYGNSTGVGQAFWSPAGRPAFTSGASYDDSPAELAAKLRALLARPATDRPLVNFVSASIWTSSLDTLIDTLLPLEDEGVRFLTPSQAAACMPDPVDPSIEPGPGDCLPTAEPTVSGLALISDTVAGEIERVPTSLDLPVTVTATPEVSAGGTIGYQISATVDTHALAVRILEDRTRPVIAASYGTELADSAWVELAFEHLVLRVPVAEGTEASGDPAVTSGGAGASARWSADGSVLEIELGALSADSRTAGEPFEVTVTWDAVAFSRPSEWTATLVAGAMSFDLAVTVGVKLGTLAATGTASAPWACLADDAVLARTVVKAEEAPAPPTPVTRPPDQPEPVPVPTTTVPGPVPTTSAPSPSTSTPAVSNDPGGRPGSSVVDPPTAAAPAEAVTARPAYTG